MAGLSSCTVLVVDDVAANIDVLVEALEGDYEVSVAMDGKTALLSVARNKPDLVLLDIMMPGMDGYEVCKRLKADEATRNIPVVFITAMSDERDEAKGLKLGAVDYVTKPFSPELVKARVRNHLAVKQARDHLEELVAMRTRELQFKVKELEARDKLVRFQMQSPDINGACQEILRVVSEVLDTEKLRIYLANASGSALQTVISSDAGGEEVSQDAVSKTDTTIPLVSRALQEKKVLSEDDNQIAAPILYRKQLLGVIWVSVPFSLKEIEEDYSNTLWRMANEAAMVLRMVRFTEDLQEDRVDFDQLGELAEQNLS